VPRLAEIVRRFGDSYLERRGGRVPAHQRKALRAIERCRTRRLGGVLRECAHCGHAHVRWHSCRNRHCPRCGARKQREWVRARLRELPPAPCAHLVFTVPAALADHCRADPKALYLIATAGVLTPAGDWKAAPEGYFLPVRALSAVFRAKCLAALQPLGQDLPRERLPKEWVVHARAPQGDPGSILLYLARYIHRVAIDEKRLLRVDDRSVTFRYKDYADGGRSKTMTLAGEEFLRRFLQHVLPRGFVKVRHYGLFAHAVKARALARLREALRRSGAAAAQAAARILALLHDFRPPGPVRCPRCRSAELTATELMPEPVAAAFRPP